MTLKADAGTTGRTKQDLYDIITECGRKNPRARIPETTFPGPYYLTETERCIVLDGNSIEEHIPDEQYVKAGMKKTDVLSRISELKVVLKNSKRGGTLKELGDLKKLVSNSIASCLVREDLKLLSTIAGAIHLAQEKAMM